MSTENNSFAVHLASLVDFAQELGTQLTGMAQPLAHLGGLSEREVDLGEFAEADLLGAHHLAAAAEMRELLGRAGQAIDFAEDVTHTIAEAYRRQDDQHARSLLNLGNVLHLSDPRTDPGRL